MANASPALRPHPASKIFPEMPPAEFNALVDDIRANGQREQIVLHEGKILDGNHRYRASKELGITPKTKTWNGKGSAVDFVVSMNLKRRHLTAGQRAAAASAAMPFYTKEAKERQRHAGKTHGRGQKDAERIPEPVPKQGEAREHAARAFGTNPHYVSDYQAVDRADPALAEEVKSGKTTLSKAKRRTKRKADCEKAAKAPTIKSVTKDTRFPCIAIDPPWDERDFDVPNVNGRATPDYATMRLAELKELPIQDLADANGHLYVWVTNRGLPFGFQLLDAWGFRHVTVLTWCKTSIGVGTYFRNNTEHVLFGVKGKLSLLRQDVGTWFEAPRCGRHSTKPDAFYELVESCSPGPRLEMFARKKRVGWTTWGASDVPVPADDSSGSVGTVTTDPT